MCHGSRQLVAGGVCHQCPYSTLAAPLFPTPACPPGTSACRAHLEASYDSADTQEDLALLRQQAAADTAASLQVPAIPGPEAGRDAVVTAAVANCEAQMAGDRKTTALKSLQVCWGLVGLPGCWSVDADVAAGGHAMVLDISFCQSPLTACSASNSSSTPTHPTTPPGPHLGGRLCAWRAAWGALRRRSRRSGAVAARGAEGLHLQQR